MRYWYQHYFHTTRGRRALTENRDELVRFLWNLWSPSWTFDDSTFEATTRLLANDDNVDVVIHSYMHRYGSVPGDPALEKIESSLTGQLLITVPTVVLHGADDAVDIVNDSTDHVKHFAGPYERRVLGGVGHNIPQEAPKHFAEAIRSLREYNP